MIRMQPGPTSAKAEEATKGLDALAGLARLARNSALPAVDPAVW